MRTPQRDDLSTAPPSLLRFCGRSSGIVVQWSPVEPTRRIAGADGKCHMEKGTALLRTCEDIGGQLAAWARHYGLGLVPEGGQFLRVLVGQGSLIVHPAHAAVEAFPGLAA